MSLRGFFGIKKKDKLGGGSSSSSYTSSSSSSIKSFSISRGKKTDPNATMEKLQDTLDMHEKGERLLHSKIEAELEKAKECMRIKNKTGALLCMKKKKLYEEQLQKIANQKHNVQTMLLNLEEGITNAETLKVSQIGAKTMKGLYGKMTVDQIEDSMDKIRDTIEDHKDISEVIAQPLQQDGGFDEDELLEELSALETDEMEKEMMGLDMASKPPLLTGAAMVATNLRPSSSAKTTTTTTTAAAAMSKQQRAITRAEEEELADLERAMTV